MRAAAEICAADAELGGKSPTIVGNRHGAGCAEDHGRQDAERRQICLRPTMFRARRPGRSLCPAAESAIGTMYPTLKDNPDYTSVINQRHYDRLQGYVADARRRREGRGDQSGEGRLHPAALSQDPPTLVLNPTEDMKIMQDEIFGPLLPVKTYGSIDEAVGYVNDHPRPLSASTISAMTARKHRRCWSARRPAA